jgi:chromosome segregation ATPase
MSETRSVQANILAGPDVLVLEMSRRELVLEADVRLTPGAGICLNVTIGGANFLAGGRVSRVDATLSGGQVRYRAGVVLDNEIPAFDQPVAPKPAAVSRNIPTEASRAPRPGAAEEEPMDAAQEHQILKTALRSAEAARKTLAEQVHALEAERAKWEEQRKGLEQRVALAEGKVDAAARQLNAGKDSAKKIEQELVAKFGREQATWEAEKKTLQEAARQAQGFVKQADTKLKELDSRFKDADAHAKQAEARIAELEAKAKAADAKAAAAEAKTAAAEAKAPAAEARAAAAETKLAATDAKLREVQARADQLAREVAAAQERELNATAKHAKAQDAWTSERASLQERLKSAESDLASARENEQRLAKQLKAEAAKVADLVQENERQIEEMESVRAALAEAEQSAARYDQDKQSWASQKERLTSRLQLTEKWCADQQDLLYSLRQHLSGATTLLDGWKPAAIDSSGIDADAAPAKNGRKATA